MAARSKDLRRHVEPAWPAPRRRDDRPSCPAGSATRNRTRDSGSSASRQHRLGDGRRAAQQRLDGRDDRLADPRIRSVSPASGRRRVQAAEIGERPDRLHPSLRSFRACDRAPARVRSPRTRPCGAAAAGPCRAASRSGCRGPRRAPPSSSRSSRGIGRGFRSTGIDAINPPLLAAGAEVQPLLPVVGNPLGMLDDRAVHVGDPEGPVRAGLEHRRSEPVVARGQELAVGPVRTAVGPGRSRRRARAPSDARGYGPAR